MLKPLSALAVWAGLAMTLIGPSALVYTHFQPLRGLTEKLIRQTMTSGIVYVNASAIGANTGDSWANAYTTLSAAIAAAHADASINTILVAKGTYYPTGNQSGTNRETAFTLLRAGLTISGGYDAATGTRNIAANTSTLSGDIGAAGTNADNSYHVLVVAGIPAGGDSLIVDGFTIEKGNANSSGDVTYGTRTIARSEGGGIAIDGNSIGNKLVLRNLLVTGNGASDGAGFSLRDVSDMAIRSSVFAGNNSTMVGGAGEISDSSPVIYSCSFLSNKAVFGAGIANVSASPAIRVCRFQGNSSDQEGGAIQSYADSNPVIESSLFSGNSALYGAATGAYQGLTTIINCTISGNKSTNSGGGSKGVLYSATTIDIRNSIVFGNTEGISGSATVSNSLVQGYTGGVNNLPGWTDPQFTQPIQAGGAPTISGSYRLRTSSPVINKGDNSAVSASIAVDLDGNPRIQLSTVDLGAYESATFIPLIEPDTLYVDYAATGLNTGVSWTDAFKTLGSALAWAADHSSTEAILVAKGTYYPTGAQNSTNRSTAFCIPRAGLHIYGGYDATTDSRDISLNTTILSGDIGTFGDNSDNSRHVLVVADLSKDGDSLIVDGFTIEKGYANSTTDTTYGTQPLSGSAGAGIAVLGNSIGNKFILRNLTVTRNYADDGSRGNGAGAYLSNASNMVIQSCVFKENTSGLTGGGLEINDSSPLIQNCSFLSNNTEFGGGGIANLTGAPIIRFCRFQGNSSEVQGGAVLSGYNTPSSFFNCLFTGNLSGYGVAICGFGTGLATIVSCTISGNRSTREDSFRSSITLGGEIDIRNSIVAGNSGGIEAAVAYSVPLKNNLVQYDNYIGTVPGDADPRFISPATLSSAPTAAGDYRLGSCSPAINGGDNSLVSADMAVDLDGNPRIQLGKVDMGAYETSYLADGATMPLASSSILVATVQSHAAKTDYFGNACQELIASITGSGTPSGISGWTSVKVWVDATPVPHHVGRHYEITPAVNGSTATARVTLYFNQAEFDAFNTANPTKPLPTGSSDNAGKANLLIVKRPGTSGDGTGSFSSYAAPAVVIDPADSDIVWSGSRWEVTFDVTGFSGFFVSTQAALPLRLLSFTAKRSGGISHLEWKTASEKNVSHFQVERGTDAQEFSALQTISARNGESQSYSFDDAVAFDGVMYYRLKMVDQDGSTTYSRTLSLTDQGATSMTDPTIKLGPVPARQDITLYLTRPEVLGQEVQLTDQRGVVLDRLTITQLKQTYRVSRLVPGVYFFRLNSGESARFVKE
ncbi:choice-of-anchor Q domain-containing protein [Siphonobacter aquaeclarae]|uniref:Por secretion system C-terminal sorting domain-containing protein n=1 Tax=Siphonobacter aquaeclarae TaxID=563176 RepID=A0A1G9HXS9_9BACT|nr:choice-of-anchor Q domain-containing protein [Siphonobacter aquaeclarae]SDL17474.1 Por secretion system C-terminal sorting domain-containing protein [Siphonobacter aquaeclarae]